MMLINDMPNECISLILKNISLSQLLPLRAVCHRWSALVATLCSSRTSLKLFGSPELFSLYSTDMRKYNLVQDEEFKVESCTGVYDNILILRESKTNEPELWTFLGLLFPNMSQLLYYAEPTECLIYLLDFWSTTLTSLAFFGPVPYSEELQDQFWCRINNLPALLRLHMFDLFEVLIPEEMPVLGQLEHLTLIRYENAIEPHLTQLGPAFKSLTLGSCRLTPHSLRLLESENPALLVNLTSLKMSQIFMNLSYDVPVNNCNSVLEYIGDHFVNLEVLDITYFRVYLVNLIPNLRRLTSLTTFHVHLDRFNDLLDHGHEKYLSLCLPSVTTLHFTDDMPTSMASVESFYEILPSIFPHIKHIYMYSFQKERLNQIKRFFPSKVGFDYERVKVTYTLID